MKIVRSKFFNRLKDKVNKMDSRILKDYLDLLGKELFTSYDIFNSISEGILSFSSKHDVIFVNDTFLKMFFINENIIGKNLNKINIDEDFLVALNRALNLQDGEKNIKFRLNSNLSGTFFLNIYPLMRNKRIDGYVAIVADVSSSEEKDLKNRQMKNLGGLKRILSSIAHEIKNPIGAISLHIQLIEQDTINCDEKCDKGEDIKYSVGILKEEVARLSNIVDNFLSNFRIKKKNLVEVNLKDFFDRLICFIKPEADSKNIKIKFHYSSSVPTVITDEVQLKQALLNLVLNSIGSISEKGINDGVIELDVRENKNFIIMSVIDNGIGISDDIKVNIFDPYFTTKQFGTGLGLTITYEIVKGLNGEINFESDINRTKFSIVLPIDGTYGLLEHHI